MSQTQIDIAIEQLIEKYESMIAISGTARRRGLSITIRIRRDIVIQILADLRQLRGAVTPHAEPNEIKHQLLNLDKKLIEAVQEIEKLARGPQAIGPPTTPPPNGTTKTKIGGGNGAS